MDKNYIYKKGNVYAFFDVDETVISIKSMFSFKKFYLISLFGKQEGTRVFEDFLENVKNKVDSGHSRKSINSFYYSQFKGHSLKKLNVLAKEWFELVKLDNSFYHEPILDRLKKHIDAGEEPVFVSGSSLSIIAPLAYELNVKHILANRPLAVEDKLTGTLLHPQTIGDGKLIAVKEFLKEKNCCAASCFAYGDHISDLPLLEYIGYPFVVKGDKSLISIAHDRGWPVIEV